jgi:hypothetical protein
MNKTRELAIFEYVLIVQVNPCTLPAFFSPISLHSPLSLLLSRPPSPQYRFSFCCSETTPKQTAVIIIFIIAANNNVQYHDIPTTPWQYCLPLLSVHPGARLTCAILTFHHDNFTATGQPFIAYRYPPSTDQGAKDSISGPIMRFCFPELELSDQSKKKDKKKKLLGYLFPIPFLLRSCVRVRWCVWLAQFTHS